MARRKELSSTASSGDVLALLLFKIHLARADNSLTTLGTVIFMFHLPNMSGSDLKWRGTATRAKMLSKSEHHLKRQIATCASDVGLRKLFTVVTVIPIGPAKRIDAVRQLCAGRNYIKGWDSYSLPNGFRAKTWLPVESWQPDWSDLLVVPEYLRHDLPWRAWLPSHQIKGLHTQIVISVSKSAFM